MILDYLFGKKFRQTISLLQPRKIAFGRDYAQNCLEDILALGLRRIFIFEFLAPLGAIALPRDDDDLSVMSQAVQAGEGT